MAKKNKLEGRIRFEDKFLDDSKYCVFEFKVNDGEYDIETAYKVLEDVNGNEVVSTRVFGHINRWQELGIPFYVVED